MSSRNYAKFVAVSFLIMAIGSHSIHLYLKPKADLDKKFPKLEKTYESFASRSEKES